MPVFTLPETIMVPVPVLIRLRFVPSLPTVPARVSVVLAGMAIVVSPVSVTLLVSVVLLPAKPIAPDVQWGGIKVKRCRGIVDRAARKGNNCRLNLSRAIQIQNRPGQRESARAEIIGRRQIQRSTAGPDRKVIVIADNRRADGEDAA